MKDIIIPKNINHEYLLSPAFHKGFFLGAMENTPNNAYST